MEMDTPMGGKENENYSIKNIYSTTALLEIPFTA